MSPVLDGPVANRRAGAVNGTRSGPPVVDLRNVTKTYRAGVNAVHAVDGVTLLIERGDYVAVMGASGSGKSTLMNIIGCLDTPTHGSYRLDGVDVRRLTDRQLSIIRNRKIGFIFQSFNLIARTTALRNVELPLAYGGVRAAERQPAQRPRWSSSDWVPAPDTPRRSCPGVSNNGWLWRGPSCPSPCCSSPTSRLARWTAEAPPRCCTCLTRCHSPTAP